MADLISDTERAALKPPGTPSFESLHVTSIREEAQYIGNSALELLMAKVSDPSDCLGIILRTTRLEGGTLLYTPHVVIKKTEEGRDISEGAVIANLERPVAVHFKGPNVLNSTVTLDKEWEIDLETGCIVDPN